MREGKNSMYRFTKGCEDYYNKKMPVNMNWKIVSLS